MDTRKIIEVLRATLDASQQAAAHEQLQQVRKVDENCAKLKKKIKHMEMRKFLEILCLT